MIYEFKIFMLVLAKYQSFTIPVVTKDAIRMHIEPKNACKIELSLLPM